MKLTTSKKPTATQLKILQRLVVEGCFIHRCTHTSINTPDSFWYHPQIADRVNGRSIHLMVARGLVEDFEAPGWRWSGSKYRITDTGRLALAAALEVSDRPKSVRTKVLSSRVPKS